MLSPDYRYHIQRQNAQLQDAYPPVIHVRIHLLTATRLSQTRGGYPSCNHGAGHAYVFSPPAPRPGIGMRSQPPSFPMDLGLLGAGSCHIAHIQDCLESESRRFRKSGRPPPLLACCRAARAPSAVGSLPPKIHVKADVTAQEVGHHMG